jgi:hypothetical protein
LSLASSTVGHVSPRIVRFCNFSLSGTGVAACAEAIALFTC